MEPLSESVAMRARILSYPDDEAFGYGRWACIEKASGEVLGFAGLEYLSEVGANDLGYRLFKRHWGRGLATEAPVASLEFGRVDLGLSRILAFVVPDNHASIRVLHKVGMEFEDHDRSDGTPCLRYVWHPPT